MRLDGTVALVTGANRGLGAVFVEQLLVRGAAKIYAAARDPRSLPPSWASHGDRIRPLRLDVTDLAAVASLPGIAPDVDLVISNAGVTHVATLPETDEATERRLMAVNYQGPLALTRAYHARLKARGDAAGLLYIVSMAALMPTTIAPIYSASKAALTMMAHGARADLIRYGVSVSLSYPGFMDTEMGSFTPLPKASPVSVANRSLDGALANRAAIFPDRFAEMTRTCLETEMPRLLADPVGTIGDLVERYATDPEAGR